MPINMSPRLMVVVVVMAGVSPYPDVVPDSACGWLAPWHEPFTHPSEDPAPYKLKTYQHEVLPSSLVQVCIVGGGVALKGFMMQGQTEEGEVLGSWIVQQNSSLAQTKTCKQRDDTVTHANGEDKKVVPLYWLAPAKYQGKVIFKAALVANFSTYWTGITSPPFKVRQQ